jgi:hypothetical protein
LKSKHLVIIIPFLFYLGAAVILAPGHLLHLYPEKDLTAYLAAVSLGKDGDLVYTREDSDRFLRDYGSRPAPFRVLQKKLMNSGGEYRSYFAFHDPELFVFALAPFTSLVGFQGWLLFHAFLIFGLLLIGWFYYRGKDPEAISPAINSVVYFTVLPVPVLFLLPSHHLYLLVVISAFLFFGLRNYPVLSAIFLAIAASSQPWATTFSLIVIGYWAVKKDDQRNPIPRFVIAAALLLFVVWGLERLMYPVSDVSETRLVSNGNHAPLALVWNSLPVVHTDHWTSPEPVRIIDFVFGRNAGFLPYGFVACALLLSSIWLFRDSLVRIGLLFTVLYLALISMIHPSSWNAHSFVHDMWVLLAPLPFFLIPLIRPKSLFLVIAIPAAFFAGPLLINPLGFITNHAQYTSSFPYKFFPVEASLIGRAGITTDPERQRSFPGGKVYFLNDNFYQENEYFWVRGESTLEFLLQLDRLENLQMKITNGVLENKITLEFGDSQEEIRLGTAQSETLELTRYIQDPLRYDGRLYVHGSVSTNSGYVPGLLSRDNPDYRFLSFRVEFRP